MSWIPASAFFESYPAGSARTATASATTHQLTLFNQAAQVPASLAAASSAHVLAPNKNSKSKQEQPQHQQ
jgi:hypothetical protein